jgi:hypothetical protein
MFWNSKNDSIGKREVSRDAVGNYSEKTTIGDESRVNIRLTAIDSAGVVATEIIDIVEAPFGLVIAPMPSPDDKPDLPGVVSIGVAGICGAENLALMGATMFAFLERNGALKHALQIHRASGAFASDKGFDA